MGFLDIFDGKEEEKTERPDPKKIAKPPKKSTLQQIGTALVRPGDVSAIHQGIGDDGQRSFINIVLKNGVSFAVPDKADLKDQISKIFNIDIKEPQNDD